MPRESWSISLSVKAGFGFEDHLKEDIQTIQKYKYNINSNTNGANHCNEHPVGSPCTSLLCKSFAHGPDDNDDNILKCYGVQLLVQAICQILIFAR